MQDAYLAAERDAAWVTDAGALPVLRAGQRLALWQGDITTLKVDAIVNAAEQREMKVPEELVPRCPKCGKPMTMNLRCDGTFVQDRGWYQAAQRYDDFVREHRDCAMLYLELGVGWNTPGIIKYPFWQMTAENPKAAYACVNDGQAYCPREIERRAVCIDGDIGGVLKRL